MKKRAYRFYWEKGTGKEAIDLMVTIIAVDILTAVNAFVSNFPNHPIEYIRNIEAMEEAIVV